MKLLVHDDRRLLTLTGAGGTGKTRLALQAAGEAVEAFPDGVFWVGLASLRDPELVLPEVAQALRAQRELQEEIADRRLLVLVDNFEHVLGAAGGLSELLSNCPNLTLLVTSREVLRLAGEREYAVPQLAEDEAVAMFRERAAIFEPEDVVRAVCVRLDCLPLAVELAAARTKVLPPPKLLERLEQALPLLTGEPRDADERQRTLRATIEWSHDLLAPEEQQLFTRLSVFAGGCTLGAAEEVTGVDLDTLQSLVEKSLLRHTDGRFLMLETIREYAVERFERTGEARDVRRRHAEWFLGLAESAGLSAGSDAEQRLDLVAPEQDNLRVALAALLQDDPTLGLRLAAALELFWGAQSALEGTRWLEAFLDGAPDAPPVLRARALRVFGGCYRMTGDIERASRLYEKSLAACRTLGDDRGVALLLGRLGEFAVQRGDLDGARALLEESLQLHTAIGFQKGRAITLMGLGRVEHTAGNRERAVELGRRSTEIFEEGGFPWLLASGYYDLADYALEARDLREAERFGRKSLELYAATGDRQNLVTVLALLAVMAAEGTEDERAGRLWGAIEAEEGRAPLGAWRKERDQYAARALAAVGPDFERGREAGRRLTLDQAVTYALESID